MQFSTYSKLLQEKLEQLDAWRADFGMLPSDSDEQHFFYSEILDELVNRLKGNFPFHHPSYAGQMLKPPHPIAWLAYTLASTINPNNHALDGGPPTSEMEKEVVSELAKMVGFENHLGHLTSSGTFANLEALWIISKQLKPGQVLAYSDNAHYTHERISSVLGIPSIKIQTNLDGTWNFDSIQDQKENIGAVIITMGTTGNGFVESLSSVKGFFIGQKVWFHIDAAYGGFFKLIAKELPSKMDWDLTSTVQSFVIDPHKHGLQPYGCGAVLFSNPEVGLYYKHDSPYTYFSSEDLHLGEISLECSRAGASAAALWATLKALPLSNDGLGSILLQCRNAVLHFIDLIEASNEFISIAISDLDIAVYLPVGENLKSCSSISDVSKKLFEFGVNSKPESCYHVSLFTMDSVKLKEKFSWLIIDSPKIVVLRSVFMKPEHEKFIPELVNRLLIAKKRNF